jgi:signal transduction histidine kinase
MGAYPAQEVFPVPATGRSRRGKRSITPKRPVGGTGRRVARVAARHPMRAALLRARVDIGARAFCLLAGFTIAMLTADAGSSAGTLVLLIAIAAVMTCWAIIDGPMTKVYLYGLIAEGSFSLTLVLVASPNSDAFVIYVTAAALLAGLRSGIFASFSVVGVQSITLLALQAQQRDGGTALLDLAGPWLMTGFAAGLLGAWIRQLRLTERDTVMTPYASAHRLLGQLRSITRELPGGLDIDVVSEDVLTTTMETLAGARAALLLRNESGTPVVVATKGGDGAVIASGDDSIVALSMGLQRPMQEPQAHGHSSHRHRMCLPLVVGSRAIGAVVVDGPKMVPKDVMDDVQIRLDDDALRLESAVLFSDVRAVATVEERRRLAREIHDGVAQEIASLGYLVDDLAREDCSEEHRSGLVSLRDELTRVVTELRLSIFDLRSGVTTNAGLGSVLADYVREVGKGSGMAVHMSLEESPRRLRIDVETELLRIAQEAVTNARKHSKATNLWVTCRVEPPFAEIRIEDDGVGYAAPKDDHYGLHIMNERAGRINAVLTISNRLGGGTAVSAVLLPADVPPQRPQSGGSHALHRAARR